mmetsp:Transcript_9059/g.19175  ORF Transcript_9059/g.19175 Transcript_9059/m.19175 type:complete len:301 (-) Transcript_9059:139-1041(-)
MTRPRSHGGRTSRAARLSGRHRRSVAWDDSPPCPRAQTAPSLAHGQSRQRPTRRPAPAASSGCRSMPRATRSWARGSTRPASKLVSGTAIVSSPPARRTPRRRSGCAGCVRPTSAELGADWPGPRAASTAARQRRRPGRHHCRSTARRPFRTSTRPPPSRRGGSSSSPRRTWRARSPSGRAMPWRGRCWPRCARSRGSFRSPSTRTRSSSSCSRPRPSSRAATRAARTGRVAWWRRSHAHAPSRTRSSRSRFGRGRDGWPSCASSWRASGVRSWRTKVGNYVCHTRIPARLQYLVAHGVV